MSFFSSFGYDFICFNFQSQVVSELIGNCSSNDLVKLLPFILAAVLSSFCQSHHQRNLDRLPVE